MSFSNILIWLLIGAILIIVADAIRRLVSERRGHLRMKIDPNFTDLPEDSYIDNNILGSARTVKRSEPQQMEFDVEPPLVMDADDNTPADNERFSAVTAPAKSASTIATTPPNEIAEANMSSVETAPSQQPKPVSSPVISPQEVPKKAVSAPATKPTVSAAAAKETSAPTIVDVIVVHLISLQSMGGEQLLEALLEHGLRYGDMKVFHCHAGDDLLFSVANAHEPGYFNIDQMEQQTFRAVTFFIKLPGPTAPLHALEQMLTAADSLAERFDGELRDENRILLSHQMRIHLREKVQEFERRLRVADAKR